MGSGHIPNGWTFEHQKPCLCYGPHSPTGKPPSLLVLENVTILRHARCHAIGRVDIACPKNNRLRLWLHLDLKRLRKKDNIYIYLLISHLFAVKSYSTYHAHYHHKIPPRGNIDERAMFMIFQSKCPFLIICKDPSRVLFTGAWTQRSEYFLTLEHCRWHT